MYQVIKRDGQVADFDIKKIAVAITKAFDAVNKQYVDNLVGDIETLLAQI